MELAIQIFQFILSISILVVLHELGHFLPAKWFKTKVEKFYLFFDPYFSILKKKIGETEYGIGWLPFGGYVKIAGMVDESMDTEQLKTPPQPWEFRSKPAWQRLIIMLGGVTVNFFLAWLIYSCLSFFSGETFHDNAKMQDGIAVTDAGKKMGLQTGDKILKIDGKPAERMETSFINMLFADDVTVERDGKEVTFPVNQDGVADVLAHKEAQLYFTNRFPAVAGSLIPSGGAKLAGMMKGDKIVAVNGKPIQYYDEVSSTVSSQKNQTVAIDVVRNNQPQTLNVKVNNEGKIGFGPDFMLAQKALDQSQVTKKYSFIEAIPRGFQRTIDVLVMQIKQFKIVFNSKTKGYKKVGGPIAIVKMMPVEKAKDGSLSIDWNKFWNFTAMFSVWLAFLNLLPIPGLDGGHVMFTLWEMITGKPVPQKVLEHAQMIGVIFLLGLMLLIFGNDIFKLVTGKL